MIKIWITTRIFHCFLFQTGKLLEEMLFFISILKISPKMKQRDYYIHIFLLMFNILIKTLKWIFPVEIRRWKCKFGNLQVEEDCVGCPLPSTPEDEAVLDSEMSEVLKAAVLGTGSVDVLHAFHFYFQFLPVDKFINTKFSEIEQFWF